ncbi:hypothetical protein GCM10011610_44530 [Nocardia rhizosphaerihabitans]|uniref:ParB/Sulfiredoxin domain-containing protein n=1 Tax=Nocardia rhizosphaerihabitans TaxID=1691570 RepID=A0ABQ2KMI2_9NOCA|nr:hypothetical protein GCM10011610_44530 [Nocardia rhizosphaerihabitans]
MADQIVQVQWKAAPEEHDYPAAADYLELLGDAAVVEAIVAALRSAPVVVKKAKDILRASQLEALTPDNPHVRKDLLKINEGKRLSPILLVRGDCRKNVPMLIADGYHRVCALYFADEDAEIPAKIAAMP